MTKPAGRRTRVEREQSMALLLQAAIRRLGREGPDRLRLADVCDDAGKDRTLAGYHFGSKAKLLARAVRQILAAAHHQAFLAPKALGVDALAASAGVYYDGLIADEDGTRALLVLERSPWMDAPLLAPVVAHGGDVTAVIERHLKAEMAAQKLDGEIWGPAAAELIKAAIFGVVAAQLGEPHRHQVQARRDQLTRSIRRMLQGWGG